jgi:hypothetical protein
MAKKVDPVVLELATLPRDQVGPFLLLGLKKEASKEQVEANWADRLRWARRQQLKVPLEDVNWARDVLNDPDRRIRADAASLNADTSEGVLTQLARRYGVEGGPNGRAWQPLDCEKALADYAPAAEVPDAAAVRAGLAVPDVPQELPAVAALLERFVQPTLDPWAPDLLPTGAVAPGIPPQDQVP